MDKLFLIIDGYNVLHTCGMLTRNVGPGTLERARNALIGYLHRYLSHSQRQRTTIVFDSSESHLPNVATEAEILIEFAINHESADDRIAELIRQHSAPKQLLVISSDHEIQRVALKRRARIIDSEIWMDQLRDSAELPSEPTSEKNAEKPGTSGVDVGFWLGELGLDSDLELNIDSNPTAPTREIKNGLSDPAKANQNEDSEIFPPGYADDLFDDDQDTP